MKKFLIALAAMVPFALNAQNAQNDVFLTAIAYKLEYNSVSFDYAFEVKTEVTVTGSGNAALSGDSYHMNGNGMEIWCDGKTRWTLDTAAKEAYIESVDDDSSDYLANPVLFLSGLDKAFKLTGISDVSFKGETVKALALEPAVDETKISSAVLYVSGNTPKGAEIRIDDGTVTVFSLSNVNWTAGTDKVWAFDVATLDDSYVVTDLR